MAEVAKVTADQGTESPPVRRSGAASGSLRSRSSSGPTAPSGCMTGSAGRAQTAAMPGRSSGSTLDRQLSDALPITYADFILETSGRVAGKSLRIRLILRSRALDIIGRRRGHADRAWSREVVRSCQGFWLRRQRGQPVGYPAARQCSSEFRTGLGRGRRGHRPSASSRRSAVFRRSRCCRSNRPRARAFALATTSTVVTPAEIAALPLEPARVKWFDKGKGFGFANVFGRPEDVFIHVEVLRQSGFADLQAGEADRAAHRRGQARAAWRCRWCHGKPPRGKAADRAASACWR